MSGDPSPARCGAPLAALVAACLAVGFGAAVILRSDGTDGPLPAPVLAAPVDAAGLRREGYDVTLAVLEAVYDAFARTAEAEIYDGLAEVSAGEALESLYLERAGALAAGGLPDQTVHELELTGGTWRIEDGAMRADVRWVVLGEVGHAEHTHMRGNAYAATLEIAPAAGAWRLTAFDLTEVDRTGAGELTTLAGDAAPGG